MIRNFFFSFLLILGLQSQAFEIPALTGPVVDEVGLLNASTKRQLEESLYQLQKSQGVQLQVYITASLQGEAIESATIKIFDQWKLGDEKTDKGLLFLIAPNEKRMRIEVGQGLEGDIPDVIAKRIIADVVRPHFSRGEFALGIVQGVATLQQYLGNEDPALQQQVQEAQQTEKSGKKSGGWVILIVIVLWLILFAFNPSLALYLLFSAMSGGRGGGGGGGGWSGGGGRSSGGGASGGW